MRREHVRRQVALERVERLGVKAGVELLNRGVIDQQIEGAPALGSRLLEPSAQRAVGDVAHDALKTGHVARQGRELRAVARHADDFRPLRAEQLHSFVTYAAGRPGEHDATTLQASHDARVARPA